jgi:ketosteroid isomerase-like protein
MASKNRSGVIRASYEAFIAGDRAAFEATMAEGFTFTSPYDDAIDKAAYFERCWPHHGLFASFDIERIFEQGDEAFVLYRASMKDGKEFRNTEFLVLDGDRIAQVHVYFGASYKDGAFAGPQSA